MFENREGQRVPQVTFRTRNESDWKPLTTDDIFKGKTVVVFSLPGAFTPTCSSTHVPRYNELAPAFFANGVDKIVCISVNDAFVMNEWARTQECGNLLMIPDGNGEFTQKMGMLVDKADLGFGKRSWRYSMLVKDGVIEKMFIEPEKPGDPFEVSDADTMLDYINPKAKKPEQVAILTREGCGFCAKAKKLLKDLGYQYSEVVLNHSDRSRVVGAITGRGTVPQVFSFGGIGATPDDHTRQCAAAALGVPLELHPEAEREIRGRFPAGEATPQRLAMGEFPRGAAVIPNPVNRIPGFSIAEHHFVPGFPQMAWPMAEWVLDTRYRALFDRQRWAEASILVYQAGESQLIPAMQTVEREFNGVKVFSLPSMGANGSRIHVELGVRGDPTQVAPAMDRLRREVAAAGFPYK